MKLLVRPAVFVLTGARFGIVPSALRRVLAAITFLLYLAPVWPLLLGVSLLVSYWEFVATRYYASLSVLNGDFTNAWVVQGFPMGLFQHGIAWLLWTLDPNQLGRPRQMEEFAEITVASAYLLGALVLGATWLIPGIPVRDAAATCIATLLLWPLTGYYPLLLAPEYWIWEMPFYLVTAVWLLSVVRRCQRGALPPPGVLTLLSAGTWIALALAQKPSLAGFAAVPIVLHVLLSARWTGYWRFGVVGATVPLIHSFVIFAYYRFDVSATQVATRNYWNFILHDAGSGTTLVPLDIIFNPTSSPSWPVFWGAVVFLASLGIAWWVRSSRHLVVLFGVVLLVVGLGHFFTIVSRPSGTSVLDLAMFSALSVPSAMALLSVSSVKTTLLLNTGALALAAAVIGRDPVFAVRNLPTGQDGTLAAMAEVRDYAQQLQRPLLLVMNGNATHPLTEEALAFYTGRLGAAPYQFGPDGLPAPTDDRQLRQLLFPNRWLMMTTIPEHRPAIRAGIAAGYALMWGRVPNTQPVEQDTPELLSLLQNPAAVVRQFEMQPGGTRFAYVAYLPR